MFRKLTLALLIATVCFSLFAEAQKVAVIDFEAQDKNTRTIANQMMNTKRGDFVAIISNNDNLELFDLEQTQKAYGELGLSSVRNMTSSQVNELGTKLGVDVVIWGTVSDLSATEIKIMANLLSLKTKSISQYSFNLRKKSSDRQAGLKVELIDKIEEIAGGEIARLFKIGEQHLAAQNYLGAEDMFKKVIEIDNQNLDAYFNLGYIRFIQNDFETSEEYYQQGLNIDPDDERILNNIAEAQRRSDKNLEAIENLERLAELKHDELIWFRIGNIYNEIEYLEEAVDAYKKAIEFNSEFDRAYYQLGVILFDNGLEEESLFYLEKASEMFPEDEVINRKLTSAYLKTGNLDNAIEKYKAQIEKSPDNTNAYYSLAGAYRTQDKNRDALETLLKLVNIDSDNPTVHIRLADIYIALDRLNDAEKSAQKANSLDSNLPEPYMLNAQIAQIRGYAKYEQFIDLEEKAKEAYGSEANRLIAERDQTKNEANKLFLSADKNLDTAISKTNDQGLIRDLRGRKQMLMQLIDQTKKSFFD
ncbi:MAG: tetratricopeptide repeat protein [Candidatus Cloacimonadia bacterium]